MPVNSNFADALNKASSPLSRVYFNRLDAEERDDFVEALLTALGHNVQLAYIASIFLDDSDREAAQRIAWLRAKARSLAQEPSDTDVVGALGEWAVLRYVGMHKAITSVSLVSLGPESKPDFLVEAVEPTYGETVIIPFDIKTTASKEAPCFYYDPALHRAKGDPHILGLRLSSSWQGADAADVFLSRRSKLILLEEYETLSKGGRHFECVGSLNGNV